MSPSQTPFMMSARNSRCFDRKRSQASFEKVPTPCHSSRPSFSTPRSPGMNSSRLSFVSSLAEMLYRLQNSCVETGRGNLIALEGEGGADLGMEARVGAEGTDICSPGADAGVRMGAGIY